MFSSFVFIIFKLFHLHNILSFPYAAYVSMSVQDTRMRQGLGEGAIFFAGAVDLQAITTREWFTSDETLAMMCLILFDWMITIFL